MKKAVFLSLLLVVVLPQLLFAALPADGQQGEPIQPVGEPGGHGLQPVQ